MRFNYGNRNTKPSVPTGQVSMRLVQEHKGTIVPEGVILNGPVPSQDSWLVVMGIRVPAEFWRGLDVKAVFYSRTQLDDFDQFDGTVGWRVMGDKATLEKKLSKHAVEFVTIDEMIVAAQEAKKRAAEKKLALESEVTLAKVARSEFDTRLNEITAGLISIYGSDVDHVDQVRYDNPMTVEMSLVDKSKNRTVTLYKGTSKITSAPVFMLTEVGNHFYKTLTYIDPPTRDAIFTAKNEKVNVTPEAAGEWLSLYTGCAGTDFYQWIVASSSTKAVNSAQTR